MEGAESSQRISAALVVATRTLRVDRVTTEVVTALGAADVPTILLKGPSIARWLYPDGGRTYVDVDLLVPSDRFERAGGVLEGLGFKARLEGFNPTELALFHSNRRLDPQETQVEVTYLRERARGRGSTGRHADNVDLHRTLPGMAVDDSAVWDALSGHTELLEFADQTVQVLDRTALALHIALHAAQHGGASHTTEDLRRALDVLTEAEWVGVAALATRLAVAELVSVGLAIDPRGNAVALKFGLSDPVASTPNVWATLAPPGALTLKRFASATIHDKIRLVRWQLLPSPAKVRYVSPQTTSLINAYVIWWHRQCTKVVPAVRYVFRMRRAQRLNSVVIAESTARRRRGSSDQS
jgi:hypothetical protein